MYFGGIRHGLPVRLGIHQLPKVIPAIDHDPLILIWRVLPEESTNRSALPPDTFTLAIQSSQVLPLFLPHARPPWVPVDSAMIGVHMFVEAVRHLELSSEVLSELSALSRILALSRREMSSP